MRRATLLPIVGSRVADHRQISSPGGSKNGIVSTALSLQGADPNATTRELYTFLYNEDKRTRCCRPSPSTEV
jgi:hypothetical protein